MKRSMKAYLLGMYGEDGHKIYIAQQDIYLECCKHIVDKSDTQRLTMEKTILPRVALYKALIHHNLLEVEAKNSVSRYIEYELGPLADKARRLSMIPLFFYIYKYIFLKTLLKDNWITKNVNNKKNSFSVEIIDCLWYNTCVENGCPNLCSVFCEADYMLYGRFKNITFKRNGTIATGAECCDFCFTNDKSNK